MRKSISSTTIAAAAGVALLAACSFKPLEDRLLAENQRTREVAIKKLKGLAPNKREAIVAPMINTLPSDDSRLANRAAEALVVIGEPAVDAVMRTIDSDDPYVRILAVSILGDIGARPSDVLPELVAKLDDPHPLVREESAHAIGRFGTAAFGAVPALVQTLSDPQAEVREAAFSTLRKLGVDVPATAGTAPAPGRT